VTRFKPGDRVFGQFFHAPVGEGTFAEYALVPESAAITLLPADLPFEMAAALPTAGMTALSLVETLGLKPGAKVLIVGASGGVGSFATQLAAGQSLHVIATASAADADRLRKLGAKEILTSRNEALVKDMKNDHPQGIDGIIDLASDRANLAALAGLVRDDGCVWTTVFTADEKALQARHLRGGNFEVKATPELLGRLAQTVQAGKLSVPIESTISLEQAPEAIARSRAGHSKGKTVIRL
jgi:NADPH:quinone reductase-like Zn-dependent oxidoreductase